MQPEFSLRSLRWYKSLETRKERKKEGRFLVEGERAIVLVASVRPELIEEIVFVTGLEVPSELLKYSIRELTAAQFKSISSSVTPQGILAVVKIPDQIYSDTLPDTPGSRILLLENIQDPGNVGTLIRTAAAFDYNGVICSDTTADPFSPKVVQATAGSILSVWIRKVSDIFSMVDLLQKKSYALIATDLLGENLAESLPNSHVVLALGNEGSGISPQLRSMANKTIRLPIDSNKAESLNVAISGAICMYLSSCSQNT